MPNYGFERVFSKMATFFDRMHVSIASLRRGAFTLIGSLVGERSLHSCSAEICPIGESLLSD
jgi:hypothetical protein